MHWPALLNWVAGDVACPWPPSQGQSCTMGRKLKKLSSGYTLLEMLIVTVVFGLIIAGTFEVYISCGKYWHATTLSVDAARKANLAIQRIVCGMGTNNGLRAASAVTIVNSTNNAWRLTVSNLSGEVTGIDYDNVQKQIRLWPNTNSIIGNNITTSRVAVNANGTIEIELTVALSDGAFVASNQAGMFISMRNQ